MARKEEHQEGRVIRTWPSKSNPNRSYELREGSDGVIYCSCPAWAFSKVRPKSCKHMVDWATSIATGGAHLAPKLP